MKLKDGAIISALVRGAVAVGQRSLLPTQVNAAVINAAPKWNEVGMHCDVTPKTLWKLDKSGELVRGDWTARELFGIPAIRAEASDLGAMCVYASFGDSRFIFEFPHDKKVPRRTFRSDREGHCVDLSQPESRTAGIRVDRSDDEVEFGDYLAKLLAARLDQDMPLLPAPKALKREIVHTIIPPLLHANMWQWAVPEPSKARAGWLDPIRNKALAVRSGPPPTERRLDRVPTQSTRLGASSTRRSGSSKR